MRAAVDGIESIDVSTGQRHPLQIDGGCMLSSGNRWDGIKLERLCGAPGEFCERYLLKHLVIVHLTAPMECEWRWSGQGWKPARIATGGVNVLPALMPHAGRWHSSAENLLVEIAPELISATAGAHSAVELRPSTAVEDPWIAQTVLALEDDLRSGSPTGRLYGETLGTALAAHVGRRYADLRRESRCGGLPDPVLRRVLEYIGDHLATNLSLQELASLAQMDAFLFVRRFKQSTGLPPHQYILRERIERAKSLLANVEMSIAEIALRSGFASQSHFATAFRRISKLSPRAYRNAVI
jgi:AraC family transcriptional regulator